MRTRPRPPTSPEAELRELNNLVRNWAAQGLLHPLPGSGRKGKGVYRRYDRMELFMAAVLFELRLYRFPWSVLARVAGLLDDTRPLPCTIRQTRPQVALADAEKKRSSRRDLLNIAIDGHQPVYLILAAGPSEDFTVEFGKTLTRPEGARRQARFTRARPASLSSGRRRRTPSTREVPDDEPRALFPSHHRGCRQAPQGRGDHRTALDHARRNHCSLDWPLVANLGGGSRGVPAYAARRESNERR